MAARRPVSDDSEVRDQSGVSLRIENHVAADVIVAVVNDFARKARLVREAAKGARNADGGGTPDEWRKKADKTMEGILGSTNLIAWTKQFAEKPRN